MRRLRGAVLLLALLALAVQAVQAGGAWPAATPWPADICGVPPGADGDGPQQTHDGAGGCPCCRAHPLVVFGMARVALPAQSDGHGAPRRLAAGAAQFDPLLAWRSLFAQGPPLSG
jgi:hypothetical protein